MVLLISIFEVLQNDCSYQIKTTLDCSLLQTPCFFNMDWLRSGKQA